MLIYMIYDMNVSKLAPLLHDTQATQCEFPEACTQKNLFINCYIVRLMLWCLVKLLVVCTRLYAMGGYRRGGQRREEAGRLQKRRKRRLEHRRTEAPVAAV